MTQTTELLTAVFRMNKGQLLEKTQPSKFVYNKNNMLSNL